MRTAYDNGYVYSFEAALTPPHWKRTNGKHNIPIEELLEQLNIDPHGNEHRKKYLFAAIEDYTSKGFDFSIAPASLALLTQSIFNPQNAPFQVLSCSLCDNTTPKNRRPAENCIKIQCAFDGKIRNHVEEIQKHPVHALSHAIKSVVKEKEPGLVDVCIVEKRLTSLDEDKYSLVHVTLCDERANLRWSVQGYADDYYRAALDALVKGYTFRLAPRFKTYISKRAQKPPEQIIRVSSDSGLLNQSRPEIYCHCEPG